MRELLQQALEALNWICEHPEEPSTKVLDAIDDIEAALSRSKWVKVADGLPVVPEGRKGVHVWVWNAKDMVVPVEAFMTQRIIDMVGGYTHWQYRQDDTPAPPEAE